MILLNMTVSIFASAALLSENSTVALPNRTLLEQRLLLELAHSKPDRHCHFLNTRTHCHKREQLPLGWPA